MAEVLLRKRMEAEDTLRLLVAITGDKRAANSYDVPAERLDDLGGSDRMQTPALRRLQIAAWAGAGEGDIADEGRAG